MGSWGVDLWDQRDVIEKHTHSGIDFLDKCASFIKERIRIEQEYARSLRRLVKQYQFKKKDEENLQYSYQHSIKSFLQQNDEYAVQRLAISEELYNTILKEMQKLLLESKTERKKALQKLTECKIQIEQDQKTLLVAKKKYDQASEDSSTALKGFETAEQSLEMTKAQILKYKKISQDKGTLASAACDEYTSVLNSFNDKQTLYYVTEVPGIINDELQEPAEKRMESFSFFLQSYSEIQEKFTPSISKCLDGMVEAAKICNPAQDSLVFIDQHKSGEMPPADVEFEEFGKAFSGNAHKRTNKTLHLHWKKKDYLSNDVANDYAYLSPAQRKKKFNKAINSLEEQVAQLEKAKAGIVKIKESSEKFGGASDENFQNQMESYEKEGERVKQLLYQYQSHLAATIDSDATRKESRSNGDQMSANFFEPVIISDVTSQEVPLAPVPPPHLQMAASPTSDFSLAPAVPPHLQMATSPTTSDFASDEFHCELHCRAVYDFSSSNDGELSVCAGEELVALDEGDGDGWIRIIRGADEGYIPTSYIEWI